MELTINNEEFDGVFRLTNWTDEDFIFLWNNKEYNFPAKSRCPMIIQNETLENIQEIRKKAAFKLATREWYKGSDYKKMSKMGNGLPPTFDEKILEPLIEKALTPLPIAKATIKERKGDSERNYKASKAIGEKDNPNFVFRDEADEVKPLGIMPNQPIV